LPIFTQFNQLFCLFFKELPDWFKMMISLTHGIQEGKKLQQEEGLYDI
jgi:hypothetical protein